MLSSCRAVCLATILIPSAKCFVCELIKPLIGIHATINIDWSDGFVLNLTHLHNKGLCGHWSEAVVTHTLVMVTQYIRTLYCSATYSCAEKLSNLSWNLHSLFVRDFSLSLINELQMTFVFYM